MLVIYIEPQPVVKEDLFFISEPECMEINSCINSLENKAIIVKNHLNAFKDNGIKKRPDRQQSDIFVMIGMILQMYVDGMIRIMLCYVYEITVIHDAVVLQKIRFAGSEVPVLFG